MTNYLKLILILVIVSLVSCTEKKTKISANEALEIAIFEENGKKIEKLNHDYNNVPDEKLLDNDGASSPLYAELKERYKNHLIELKKTVEATGAKLAIVIIKPVQKPGDLTKNFIVGRPFIVSCCQNLNIDCYDLSSSIDEQDPKIVTLYPKDGHWSKKGSEFLANLLSPLVKKYAGIKSTVVYKESERPETFGDMPSNDDEFLDGGKDLPYHLKANVQGLRMDYDLKFPKTKQRILFMGSSHVYSPFLDNEFIATSILQKMLPYVEILNVATLSASIDDHVTLFNEKSKYAEPDVVFVQTNGGDIIHLYFSNRNHISRNKVPHFPSAEEEKFYNKTYKNAITTN